ncbi:hypothetical protein TOPH_09066 [Tolypocladium ophioglossoides CBS 100239]|uniref:Alpha-galactosidase A n=1 Tax=Tolypocladium ophioglossoides (strain CBS 100239) TaxID=1163406 RepID=A0A0L0MXV9_TOLOC|nr:hypothetical protein TOPH_09066 [Tolypocladium ophioglossoides CBS 100239]
MESSTTGQDESYYRILVGSMVKYVVVAAGALERFAIMDMPLNFENILPPLPYQDSSWNVAHIYRATSTGELKSSLSQQRLKGVCNKWHPVLIDFLELERVAQLGMLTQECTWCPGSRQYQESSATMIAKMARFVWEVPYIERETKAYQILEGIGIGPRFLGHVHEQGRIIGILLEKVEGRNAGIEDLESCTAALKCLHARGVVHGDCNRYNFVISPENTVFLVDFEGSSISTDEDAMKKEIATLEAQLREETGRGGPAVLIDGSDDELDLNT